LLQRSGAAVSLIRGFDYWSGKNEAFGFLHFGCRVASGGAENDLTAAVIAANINALRRHAPFAYLFAVGWTVEAWRKEDIGQEENSYRNALDMLQLRHGVRLGRVDYSLQEDTPVVVTAILAGDVTPFAYALDINEDEWQLLCLPRQRSLIEIDAVIAQSNSPQEAHRGLLAQGGCTVTAHDTVFQIVTLDPDFCRYFSPD
jgi:hypothetical protein